MESLKRLYKIGYGPSSSHTMGPQRAATLFKDETPNADHYDVILYGSLAATGKGHLTDFIIEQSLEKPSKIIFKPEIVKERHANAMEFLAYDDANTLIKSSLYYSIGGGEIISDNDSSLPKNAEVYPEKNFQEILQWCIKHNKKLPDYVENYEGIEIWDYLKTVLYAMKDAVERGLKAEGVIPGKLQLERKAKQYYDKFRKSNFEDRLEGRVYAYALAVSEENAAAGKVVTAPTCGSCGIIPALLMAYRATKDLTDDELVRALAVAGILGNVIKKNASISGAEVGCQGEIGSACSMGAGMIAYLLNGSLEQIEYAAEIAMEHCLGMTCDPIEGYVQIPCIERNAIYSAKAIDCAYFSLMSDGSHLVSFDEVIDTMNKTGRDLRYEYRETSLAGLAKVKLERLLQS